MSATTTETSGDPAGAAAERDRRALEAVREGVFFIVGCGRSGTTLLVAMLLAGGEAAIPPETKYYGAYGDARGRFPAIRGGAQFERAMARAHRDLTRRGVTMDRARFEALARAGERSHPGLLTGALAAHAESTGRPRVGEKSPVHTHYVGRIMEDFPRARFVHLLRDPRAVVLSRMTAGFGTSLIGPNIERWRRAAQMHERCAPALGPERYLVVRYESLVADRRAELERLCAFLGLSVKPEMLEHHKGEKRAFAERSSGWMQNTLRPVFTGSVDKWRREMKPAHVALVEHALRREMAAMGYEPSGARTWLPGARVALSRLLGRLEDVKNRGLRGVRKAGRAVGIGARVESEEASGRGA